MDANAPTDSRLYDDLVSIHAPVMDAKLFIWVSDDTRCFNPRARDGRENGCTITMTDKIVSIHAPVMDANPCMIQCYFADCFNPRARDGRE